MSLFFCIQANSNLLWHIKFLACIYNIKKQWSYKPGSVHGNSMHKALFPAACHLSTTGVTTSLYRSTLRLGRTTLTPPPLQQRHCRYTRTFNIRSAQHACHHTPGGLLLHLLTLTHKSMRAVIFFCTDQPSLTPTR